MPRQDIQLAGRPTRQRPERAPGSETRSSGAVQGHEFRYLFRGRFRPNFSTVLDDLLRYYVSATAEGIANPFCKKAIFQNIYPPTLNIKLSGPASLEVDYCDLTFSFDPETNQAVSILFDKRRGPAYQGISFRRFPHPLTNMSERCTYGVLVSQLFRFRRVTSVSFDHFVEEALRLMLEMSFDGYDDIKLLRLARRFVVKSGLLYGRKAGGTLFEIRGKYQLAKDNATELVENLAFSPVAAAAFAAHTAAHCPLTRRTPASASAAPPPNPATNASALPAVIPFHLRQYLLDPRPPNHPSPPNHPVILFTGPPFPPSFPRRFRPSRHSPWARSQFHRLFHPARRRLSCSPPPTSRSRHYCPPPPPPPSCPTPLFSPRRPSQCSLHHPCHLCHRCCPASCRPRRRPCPHRPPAPAAAPGPAPRRKAPAGRRGCPG